MFGHPSVLSGQPTRYEVRAREDTLCYSLAAEDVIPLLGRPSSLRYLVRSTAAAELREVTGADWTRLTWPASRRATWCAGRRCSANRTPSSGRRRA